MPAFGTAIVPIANARQTSRTYAADVASSASPSTPDRNGRSTRSSTGPRTPAHVFHVNVALPSSISAVVRY